MKESNKIYSIALLGLLTLSAYFLADTVNAMIGRSLEASPKFTGPLVQDSVGLQAKRELAEYSSILDRGLFGDGKAPQSEAASMQSASSYVLIGTVEGDIFAGAVLQEGTTQTFYRMHEKMPDGSQIIQVFRDRVKLKRADGSTTDIQIVDDTKIVNVASNAPSPFSSGGVRKMGGGKYMVDEREIASSSENLNQLLTQARAVPFMEGGKTVGFRITEIVPDSLYQKIGLVNGDIIQRVNAQDLDNPGQFFQMYQGLKDEKHISVDLLRNGQRQTLNYDIQ